MRKLVLIALKDLKLAFRDRAALTFMLLAPFLLTLGLGFVTGAFRGDGSGGIEPIPVVLVNQDKGRLGQALVEVFQSAELADLVLPAVVSDPQAARAQVDADEAAAAVIVPSGFTGSILPLEGQISSGEVVQIEVYKNPARPVSAGVIQAIVAEFISRLEMGRIGGQVMVVQMLQSGLITPEQIPAVAAAIGERQVQAAQDQPPLRLRVSESAQGNISFNPMAYLAPGMALLFLMYTVINGGRSLLLEKAQGTLPRLLISPTGRGQVLLGKLFGAYLMGVLQMLILVFTSSLLFGLRWGDPLGLFALILFCVFGALGWGMLVTVLARTPGQVSTIGSALMLTFGILGGSFVQLPAMPMWFRWLSHITPNAWGLDGFTILAMGGRLLDLGEPLLGLTVMGILLSGVAILVFQRRPLL